jgi:hypothetical protein
VIDYQTFIDWLEGQIRSRHEWLDTHGTSRNKWPEHDLEAKRDGLGKMERIRGILIDLRDGRVPS